MKKISKIIFVVLFSLFFAANAFGGLGGDKLTEEQKENLVKRFKEFNPRIFFEDAGPFFNSISKYVSRMEKEDGYPENLNDLELYKKFMENEIIYFNVCLVGLVMRRFPDIAERFFEISKKKEIVCGVILVGYMEAMGSLGRVEEVHRVYEKIKAESVSCVDLEMGISLKMKELRFFEEFRDVRDMVDRRGMTVDFLYSSVLFDVIVASEYVIALAKCGKISKEMVVERDRLLKIFHDSIIGPKNMLPIPRGYYFVCRAYLISMLQQGRGNKAIRFFKKLPNGMFTVKFGMDLLIEKDNKNLMLYKFSRDFGFAHVKTYLFIKDFMEGRKSDKVDGVMMRCCKHTKGAVILAVSLFQDAGFMIRANMKEGVVDLSSLPRDIKNVNVKLSPIKFNRKERSWAVDSKAERLSFLQSLFGADSFQLAYEQVFDDDQTSMSEGRFEEVLGGQNADLNYESPGLEINSEDFITSGAVNLSENLPFSSDELNSGLDFKEFEKE